MEKRKRKWRRCSEVGGCESIISSNRKRVCVYNS
jgi:hypothetical protein